MPTPDFALRGYGTKQVDTLVQQAAQALESADRRLRTSTREALQGATLQVRMRGYDRQQVDDYLDRLARQLA